MSGFINLIETLDLPVRHVVGIGIPEDMYPLIRQIIQLDRAHKISLAEKNKDLFSKLTSTHNGDRNVFLYDCIAFNSQQSQIADRGESRVLNDETMPPAENHVIDRIEDGFIDVLFVAVEECYEALKRLQSCPTLLILVHHGALDYHQVLNSQQIKEWLFQNQYDLLKRGEANSIWICLGKFRPLSRPLTKFRLRNARKPEEAMKQIRTSEAIVSNNQVQCDPKMAFLNPRKSVLPPMREMLEQIFLAGTRAVLSQMYRYTWDGDDGRLMSFDVSGEVKVGRTEHEKIWNLHFNENALELVISSENTPTCALKMDKHGTWIGRSIDLGKIPIRLIPC